MAAAGPEIGAGQGQGGGHGANGRVVAGEVLLAGPDGAEQLADHGSDAPPFWVCSDMLVSFVTVLG